MHKMEIKDNADDYEPYDHRSVKKPLTNFQALLHITKGAIGTGILGLPYAWRSSGYVAGFIGTILLTMLSVYALHVMIGGMYRVAKRSKRAYASFPEAAELACSYGPAWLKYFTPAAAGIARWVLAVKQFGTCCVYLVFVADNMKKFFDFYTGLNYDNRIYILIIMVPAICIFLLKNLKLLAPVSGVASLFVFVAFCGVMYYVFQNIGDMSKRNMFNGFSFIPVFYGTVFYAATSIGVCIAVESEMETAQDFLTKFGLLNIGSVIVTIINCLVAFCGYWKYGEETKDNITLNLPQGEIVTQIVLILFSFAIFFSFPIHAYVSHTTIWRYVIAPKFSDETRENWEYAFRAIFVLIAAGIAVTIHFFGALVSLVGGVLNSLLLLVIPGFIDIGIRYDAGYGKWKFYFIRDIILILIGLSGAFCSATLTTINIIKKYSAD